MVTRLLIYLLVASELLAAACWYYFQWKQHSKRRESDLILAAVYFFLALSYAAYGAEGKYYEQASYISYIADAGVALVLFYSIVRKLLGELRAFWKNRTNLDSNS